jgi:hypothetical protein
MPPDRDNDNPDVEDPDLALALLHASANGEALQVRVCTTTK